MLYGNYQLTAKCTQCAVEVKEFPACLHEREGYNLAAWICPACGTTNFTLANIQIKSEEGVPTSVI